MKFNLQVNLIFIYVANGFLQRQVLLFAIFRLKLSSENMFGDKNVSV